MCNHNEFFVATVFRVKPPKYSVYLLTSAPTDVVAAYGGAAAATGVAGGVRVAAPAEVHGVKGLMAVDACGDAKVAVDVSCGATQTGADGPLSFSI